MSGLPEIEIFHHRHLLPSRRSKLGSMGEMRNTSSSPTPDHSSDPPSGGRDRGEDPTSLRAFARTLGFHSLGVAEAGRSRHADRYLVWLQAGKHGSMDYLSRHVDRRIDPRKSLPGARTVVVVTLPYDPDPEFPPDSAKERGKIARYARGRDYHKVMKPRLHSLASEIGAGGQFQTWYTADAGPLLERDWAEAAGIGWIGKNGLLIDREIGSWFFLGAVVTDRHYDPDSPGLDQCGRCTRCLDACPTDALADIRSVDATKCISYWTIERDHPVDSSEGITLGGWVFGCDICQEVCPWNTRPARTGPAIAEDLQPRALPDKLRVLASLDREQFLEYFRGTAVMRAGENRLSASARAIEQAREAT